MWTSRSVLGLPKATKGKNNFFYVQYIFFSPSVISQQPRPGILHSACSSLRASFSFGGVTRKETRRIAARFARHNWRACPQASPTTTLPLSSIITNRMHSLQTRCILQCEQWHPQMLSRPLWCRNWQRVEDESKTKSWGEDDMSKIEEGRGRERFPLSPPFPTPLTHPSLPALLP